MLIGLTGNRWRKDEKKRRGRRDQSAEKQRNVEEENERKNKWQLNFFFCRRWKLGDVDMFKAHSAASDWRWRPSRFWYSVFKENVPAAAIGWKRPKKKITKTLFLWSKLASIIGILENVGIEQRRKTNKTETAGTDKEQRCRYAKWKLDRKIVWENISTQRRRHSVRNSIGIECNWKDVQFMIISDQ